MDIGPGDEVVCLNTSKPDDDGRQIVEGAIYRIVGTKDLEGGWDCSRCGQKHLMLCIDPWPNVGWCYLNFAKREPPPPRDLKEWLAQPVDFEGPRRVEPEPMKAAFLRGMMRDARENGWRWMR